MLRSRLLRRPLSLSSQNVRKCQEQLSGFEQELNEIHPKVLIGGDSDTDTSLHWLECQWHHNHNDHLRRLNSIPDLTRAAPSMPEQSQYAAAARVPLIKSPSLRVPPPVVLPPDIHPLPESVTAYFVYPFTLEPHVVTLESSRRSTIAAHATRRETYLRSRYDEKERRKRDALRRIAPGFEPQGPVLVPTRTVSGDPTEEFTPGHRQTKSAMEDLVDQLAALESDSRQP